MYKYRSLLIIHPLFCLKRGRSFIQLDLTISLQMQGWGKVKLRRLCCSYLEEQQHQWSVATGDEKTDASVCLLASFPGSCPHKSLGTKLCVYTHLQRETKHLDRLTNLFTRLKLKLSTSNWLSESHKTKKRFTEYST